MIHDNAIQNEPASKQSSIRVGACGWEHAHWQGSFYPHDLPQDWRLAYYANEFSAVLLEETVWRSAEIDLEDFSYEVGENFRFYLRGSGMNTENTLDESRRIQQQLGKHFGGFVDVDGEGIDKNSAVAVITMGSKDLRGWRRWLENWQQGGQKAGEGDKQADNREKQGFPLQAIFLNDPALSYKNLNDFKSLVELLNL